METIYSSSNETDVLILKEMLEKQNIRTNVLRKGASDYLNISGGNLISDIELQVVASDVERAKEIIKMTEYLNESNQKEQSEFEESSQKKHITDKKVLFARFMLLFMLMVIIIYIISQVL